MVARKTIPALILMLACFLPLSGLDRPVRIAASIFPLFDFARSVAGERGEVRLLLPPGADVHNWQLRPRDIVNLSRADLVVFIGSGLEPWTGAFLKNRKSLRGRLLEAGAGLAAGGHHRHEGEDDRGGDAEAIDPHVWLDFHAAEVIVLRIRDELAALDPQGAGTYRTNASAVVESLRRLDEEFRRGLSRCRAKTFVLGGHAAFGYLAARYGLEQVSLYGISPEAEPTVRRVADAVALMRQRRLSAVFYEENSSRKLAEVLARETGAELLGLDPGGNPTREQVAAGITFLDIMRRNLASLRRGLGCE